MRDAACFSNVLQRFDSTAKDCRPAKPLQCRRRVNVSWLRLTTSVAGEGNVSTGIKIRHCRTRIPPGSLQTPELQLKLSPLRRLHDKHQNRQVRWCHTPTATTKPPKRRRPIASLHGGGPWTSSATAGGQPRRSQPTRRPAGDSPSAPPAAGPATAMRRTKEPSMCQPENF
jgi:hypothetical protein